MIHFNDKTRTFNLLLKRSYYAFQVDEENRLVHLGWGSRPEDAADNDLISGSTSYETYFSLASFETQIQPDEILTFGDVTSYQTTLESQFSLTTTGY